MGRVEETRRYVKVETEAGSFRFTKREFEALETAAKNRGEYHNTLAHKMGLEEDSYNNLLTRVYRILLLSREDIAKQEDAAIEWYDRSVRPYRGQDSQTAPILLPPVKDLPPPAVNDHQTTYLALLGLLYVFLVGALFVPIQLYQARDDPLNDIVNLYNFLPLFGAGFLAVRQHQAQKYLKGTLLFRSDTTWISVGLIAWAIGGFTWLVLNIAYQERLPYPSWPDIGYLIGNSAIIFGIARITGIYLRTNLRRLILTVLLVALFATGIATIVLALRGWQLIPKRDPAKLFLDIFYPTIDLYGIMLLCFFITQDEFCSFTQNVRNAIYIVLCGIGVLFLADLSFSITTTLPDTHPLAFYNGNLTELTFLSSFFLISVALLSLPYSAKKV